MSTAPITNGAPSALHRSTMLASLHISRWAGTRTDKQVTSEVAAKHAVAERRAGHYRKHAVNVDAPTFKAVVTAAGALRTTHDYYTMPWGENGSRILPAQLFDKYSDAMRKGRADFDRAAAAFIADFPALQAAARVELNGMFNETDYPKDIASKFSARVVIIPLPDANDFRVNLPDGAVAAIKSELEEEMQRSTATAMREPYERLHKHVSRMVLRLSDPEETFRDTLISGLADLCEVLPALNITGDPLLADLCTRAEQLIAGVDPQKLRDDLTARETVAKGAQDIQSMMAAYMGAAT